MSTELTDLLPEDRRSALSRIYFLRLATLTVLLGVSIVASAGVLLFPTYVLVASEIQTKTAHLGAVNSGLTSADEKELSKRLATLTNDASALGKLGTLPSPTAIVRNALSVSRPGITLSNFSYTPGNGKSAGTLILGGSALTRDALRTYQLALQSASFVAKADLPVSSYAKDSNIDFMITVTLAP